MIVERRVPAAMSKLCWGLVLGLSLTGLAGPLAAETCAQHLDWLQNTKLKKLDDTIKTLNDTRFKEFKDINDQLKAMDAGYYGSAKRDSDGKTLQNLQDDVWWNTVITSDSNAPTMNDLKKLRDKTSQEITAFQAYVNAPNGGSGGSDKQYNPDDFYGFVGANTGLDWR